MGTVTGFTAQKMQQIQDSTVVSGHVDFNTGHLILTTRDASTIDAGYVVGPPGAAGSTTLTLGQQLLSPVGGIQPFAGVTIPTGWLECNGASLARSGQGYDALFAALSNGGTPIYGAFDANTFYIPNLQGKFPVGKSGVVGDPAYTLGSSGGDKNAIIVAHAHTHSHGGATANASLSHHKIAGDLGERIWVSAAGAQNNTVSYTPAAGAATLSHVDDHDAHGHTINSDSTSAGILGTDKNMPPFVVIKYIIRY